MRKRRIVYLTLLLTLLLFSTLFMVVLTVTGVVSDETPPEAVITFDPETLEIVVFGVDDFDQDVEVTSVVLGEKHDKTTMKYILTDDAGNYMEITLELKEKKEHAEVKVLELSYNGGETIVPEKNHYRIYWNPKDPLKHLHQKIDVHHQLKVKTHYKAKRNETKIDIEVKGQPKEKITLPGLVIVGLVTDNGSLNHDIEVTDSVPPEIVWVFFETPEYDEYATISAYVTDVGTGVDFVNLSYSAGTIGSGNILMSPTDGLYVSEIPPFPYNTTVELVISAYDEAGNPAVPWEGSYRVTDSRPPVISYVDRTPVSPNYNEAVLVSANVTEPLNASGVKSVTLGYWDGSAWTYVDMTLRHTLYVAVIPELPYGTTVQYWVHASDWAGNLAAAGIYSYTVGAPPSLPPVANFTESAETVLTGEVIQFNASGSYDPDGGDIVSYLWDFGDETSAAGVEVAHSYDDDGVYTVTLTVIDDDGATASVSVDKTVLNRPPVASFTTNITTVETGEAIRFDASDSYDPDGYIVSYFWDFGDGTNATGVTVDHTYEDDGNYTVTLTVTDDDGASSLFSATKTVERRPGWPLAWLAAIGLGIAALTATLLYALYRRRKKRRASASSSGGFGSPPIVTLYVPAKILAGCN